MKIPPLQAPRQKHKTENKYNICLICEKESRKNVIKTPIIESLQKLLLITREQAEYVDTKVYEFFERSKCPSGDGLVKYKACYHKNCYNEFINIEKRNRALQRYTYALEQGKSIVVKRKAGLPSTSKLETENEVRQLRLQSIKYDKTCV